MTKQQGPHRTDSLDINWLIDCGVSEENTLSESGHLLFLFLFFIFLESFKKSSYGTNKNQVTKWKKCPNSRGQLISYRQLSAQLSPCLGQGLRFDCTLLSASPLERQLSLEFLISSTKHKKLTIEREQESFI